MLDNAWDKEKGSVMSPESAYSTLEVPMEVDEEMLITIYSLRVRVSVLSFETRLIGWHRFKTSPARWRR